MGLSRDLLNFKKIATDELIGKGRAQITMDRVELARIARYAAEDADIALRLADRFDKQLDEIPVLRKLNDDLETPLIDVLVEMEWNGVAIDPSDPQRTKRRPRRAGREAPRADLRASRDGIQHRLAQAASGCAVRQAESADAKAHQDRLEHRCRSARTTRDKTPRAEADSGISQPGEAQKHVPRQPHRIREPAAPAECTAASIKPARSPAD